MRRPRAPVVLKFGGGALADLPRTLALVRSVLAEGRPTALVVSARRGVTDRLEQILATPHLKSVHRRLIDEIISLHPNLPTHARSEFGRLKRLVSKVELARRVEPRLSDAVLSVGERLAVHWLTARLNEVSLPAVAVEADHLGLRTDNTYGGSRILLGRSSAPVRNWLQRLLEKGQLPVITGYIGRSLEGNVATLGRGGSDYSATAVGAILGAERVELVKGEVAVLTADPSEVPGARPLPALSYAEAEELAEFGTRILHPLTIEPARSFGIPIGVRSLASPEAVTWIGGAGPRSRNRVLSRRPGLSLLKIRVPGGMDRPGIVGATGGALARAGVNVVTAWTSAHEVWIVVARASRSPARSALGQLLVRDVSAAKPVAVLTIIGEGVMREIACIPSSILLRSFGIIATPRSLTFVVPEAGSLRTLRELHRSLVGPTSGGVPTRRPSLRVGRRPRKSKAWAGVTQSVTNRTADRSLAHAGSP